MGNKLAITVGVDAAKTTYTTKQESNKLYNLALSLIPGVGNVIARKLVDHFGDAKTFLTLPISEIKDIPRIGKKTASYLQKHNILELAQQQLDYAKQINANIIDIDSDLFPQKVKQFSYGPFILYTRGNVNLNNDYNLSVVGTRNATSYGKGIIKDCFCELSSYQPQIISGLAFGIDKIAHEEALNNGLESIAVLATSVDQTYPKEHAWLTNRLMENGGVVSEYPFGSKLDNSKFAARNRIIAALSKVLLVVEAPVKSGALITAKFAEQFGTDVIAVPGNMNRHNSLGCNNLIKQHLAHIYTSPQDIIDLSNWSYLPINLANKQVKKLLELTSIQQEILQLMEPEEIYTREEVVNKSSLERDLVLSNLLNLEFNSVIVPLPGDRITIKF